MPSQQNCCRSFDQFANLVLEGAVERIISGSLYAEDPLGLYVVRGENVVLLGDIDGADNTPSVLKKVMTLLSSTFGQCYVHHHSKIFLSACLCHTVACKQYRLIV